MKTLQDRTALHVATSRGQVQRRAVNAKGAPRERRLRLKIASPKYTQKRGTNWKWWCKTWTKWWNYRLRSWEVGKSHGTDIVEEFEHFFLEPPNKNVGGCWRFGNRWAKEGDLLISPPINWNFLWQPVLLHHHCCVPACCFHHQNGQISLRIMILSGKLT